MCEIPSFYEETFPRARKPYRCEACRFRIAVGEKHVAISGKWEGAVETIRVHDDCYGGVMLATQAARESGEDCLAFSEALDFVREWDGKPDENVTNARKSFAKAIRGHRRLDGKAGGT